MTWVNPSVDRKDVQDWLGKVSEALMGTPTVGFVAPAPKVSDIFHQGGKMR